MGFDLRMTSATFKVPFASISSPKSSGIALCERGRLSGGGTHGKKMSKAFDSSTRRVTYPESYITKYTTYTKIMGSNKPVSYASQQNNE